MAELRLSKGLIAAIIAIVAVVIVLMMVTLAYNGMVSKDQGVQSHWSDVEVAYQRKIELIPTMYQGGQHDDGFRVQSFRERHRG